MKISLAEKKDLKSILELQKACYLEEAELYNDFSIPPLTQTLASIELDFENEKILKIESDGEVIGSVRGSLDSDTCKIGRLIVKKEFRKQGLGTRLMNQIESQFKAAKRFELFTGHKSDRNLILYTKLGYSEFRKQRINKKLELIFLEKNNTKNSH
ncbi:ribosomal protein S18 acetylase RimI-like enzyme [Aquimarina sp. EL_43]|uniref:GNAT family N-acetyltransferase n=1 Tax=Aquimarina TaxID=290174 RepID=UPI00046EC8E6|nr:MULTISPECIES: GNAT family N-acetyltransferase [Aquimarina]MBG6133750.1 ribosomal protein S18 acetylase RimI-like enzyme [Aquimarina sp. EL_35]MBG6153911.1 ribosomal protein S18 acetylase RimI-like enzyme [Aquimarina sp. EL_32]MBG6172141.1 ribosomal protein S18 acetylase RimI-like enzyme [Aquimarina sp. EL_43]